MEKRESPYIVAWNVNWYSHFGEEYGGSLKLKIHLSYNPGIALLGIYLEKTILWKRQNHVISFVIQLAETELWHPLKNILLTKIVRKKDLTVWYWHVNIEEQKIKVLFGPFKYLCITSLKA